MTQQLPFSESLVITGDDETHRIAPPSRGRVLQRYGARVELWLDDDRGTETSGSVDLDPALLEDLSATERLGVEALQLRRSTAYQQAKAARPRHGETWDMAACVGSGPDDVVARTADTSDYLEGSVAVGIVIVNGPSAGLRFSPQERTKVLGEAQTGLAYLAAVNPAANVTFSYDIRVVDIDVPADPDATNLEAVFRDAALAEMGFTSTKEYVEKIRADLGTQWAYAAYFTKYPVDHFAYANSLRVVMHWENDGWGHDNIDRVFAHETGHVFGCPDEYSAECTCGGSHGRFGHPNDNCENCGPVPGGGIGCIMKKNDWAMCNATYRHLGWMAPVRCPDRAWVTAVSSTTDRLDVFTVDKSKWIRTAFWQPGMDEWFQGWLHVAGGQAAPGSPITAASRRPGQLDVFVVGLSGHVDTAARAPGGDWKGWWTIGDLVVPQGGHIGAVSRSTDQLDIFAVDVEGQTMTASWAPWHPDGWSDWREINGGRAAPGSPITAVSRSKDLLDIFVTGTTGGVATAAWTPDNPNGWAGWWHLNEGMTLPGTPVGVVSRATDCLDAFVLGTDDRPATASWTPGFTDGWWGWSPMGA